MPGNPRPKGKAAKIAEKILGIVPNMKKQTNIKRNNRLLYEETKLIK